MVTECAGQPVIYISEQHLTIADVLSLVVLGRFWNRNQKMQFLGKPCETATKVYWQFFDSFYGN